ncbi:ADP-ribosylglycohydrolase family protein [Affinibrenneria salicis]|uniref:ADP-ribosylglycohydrolase family protein n=1 Tax=Affinibrenneria salicis TaxID=2590031 RepID=A0A5J5FW28_9GAMM|nr:ADP-ribosylarginine hydrolase Tri1 [Affinibrenneria salicis]KAA8997685.1 ADP-ribosylglycohydrolase family protein [Affinibrenneria salicis]
MIDMHQHYQQIAGYVQAHYLDLYPPAFRPLVLQSDSLSVDYRPWLSGAEPVPDWLRFSGKALDEETRTDRAKGALVGLAAADAVGTTLEFRQRDEAHVDDMVGGGPFNLKAGEWTDDTSMALCLAETYIHARYLDLTGYRNRLVNWYRHGVNSSNGVCFDIGNATHYALEQYLSQGPEWFGNSAPSTAGNAAIIRLAPAAIFQRHSLLRTCSDAEWQGMATHGAIESRDCSRLLGMILHRLLNGSDKEEALAAHMCCFNARTMLINAGEYKRKTREQICSSGYVIDTLEAALWAVWRTDNFRDAVLLAANLADDADSVAATAGQIAGALYGYSSIPAAWRDKLVEQDRTRLMAEDLYRLAPR